MSKGILKYRNPNYVEGGDEPKWISLGTSSGGSSGGDTGGGGNGGDGTQYEKVNVSISASNGSAITADVTVNGETKSVTSGSSVMWEVPYGTEYGIVSESVEGYGVPESLSFVAGQEIRNVELVFEAILVTTIRINQAISDPETMIARLVDNGGIEAIRANSHRYTGKVNEEGIMEIKQLNDANSEVYLDGTVAPVDGSAGDFWMKLPKFYYKSEHVVIEGLNNDDIYDLSFAYGGKPDGDWKEWDGKVFVGAYLMTDVEGRSLPNGKAPLSNCGYDDVEHNLQSGYQFMRWDALNMLSFLFYAYYGRTDYKNVIGYFSSNTTPIGTTESLGMRDTDSETQENYAPTNFWGIENFETPVPADLHSVMLQSESSFSPTIFVNHDGSKTVHDWGSNPTKFALKIDLENFILLATEGGDSNNIGYCRQEHVATKNSEYKGVIKISILNTVSDYTVGPYHMRICYHGDYIILN